MANESSAVLGGVVGGLVFIGIAVLVGDYFYEQCVDDWLDDNNCLGDDWYLKDGECCTTRYSWQAWCCGLPFALIGIGIIGASLSPGGGSLSPGGGSLSPGVDEIPKEKKRKTESSKKEGKDVESTREKYGLGEEYSDEDIAFVNQWKNEIMEEEPEPKKAVKKKVIRKSVSKKVVSKAAPPSDGSENSLADELKKLNELKEQGIIDEKEFKTAKKKLLEQ